MTDEEKAAEKQKELDDAKAAEEAAALELKEKEAAADKSLEGWDEKRLEAHTAKMFEKGAKKAEQAAKKAAEEMQAKLDALQTQFTELSDKKRGSTTDSDAAWEAKIAELKGEYSERQDELAGQLKEATEGRESDQQAHFTKELEAQVLKAAAESGATSPANVFVLMQHEGFFRRDDDSKSWNMLNPDTKRIRIDVDEGGDPLSLAKGVAEYLDARPEMVRSSGRSGSGPGGDSNVSGHEQAKKADFKTEDLSASEVYAKARELARHVQTGGKVSIAGRSNQSG